MWIEKVEEHYNPHTRTVTKTRKNAQGKTETYTETEVYYSWDYYDSWEKHSSRIQFCGQEFDYGKIESSLRGIHRYNKRVFSIQREI